MANITVYGKDNLGLSLKFGEIRKGEEYTIDEKDFADQLFTREAPATGEETIKGGKKK